VESSVYFARMIRKLIGDPLIHFLFIGGALYYVLSSANLGEFSSQNNIHVSDSVLIEYMRQNNRSVIQQDHALVYEAFSKEQKRALLDAYIENEVLIREAKKLGLDKGDNLFNQRLVQRMRYFLDDFSDSKSLPTEQQLQNYYRSNQSDYAIPSKISFVHVFFKFADDNRDSSLQLASLSLSNQHKGIQLSGDNFPYHRQYISKNAGAVSRHFGQEFAKAVFGLAVDQDQWQGPIESAYGHHLVRILTRQPATVEDFSQVKIRVQQDFLSSQKVAFEKQRIAELIDSYNVVLKRD